MKNKETIRRALVKKAAESYRQSDNAQWISAAACARIVGNYDRGATMGMADDMSVSVDTIEDLAHAYWLFEKLCKLDNGNFRLLVFSARRSSYIYISHFRALYDYQNQYGLTDTQVLDLLNDIIQHEGSLSTRKLETHLISRFGDTRDWTYWGARALKELDQMWQQPDFPNTSETIGQLYVVKLKVDGKKRSFIVVANNPQRAENIARKEAQKTANSKKMERIDINLVGDAITDSKSIVHTTHSWLGEKA